MLRLCFLVAALWLASPSPAASLQAPPEAPVAPTLQPGDLVRVQIWREPELSGEFQVNLDGSVTFPLIGTLPVTDVPLDRLRDRLIAAYRAELRNPSITVVPLRRIYVLGDVARPNVYLIDPTSSLATVVAMAGGPSAIGDVNNIRVVRDGETILSELPMDQAIDVVDLQSGDQVYVGRIHWVRRNIPYLVGLGFTLYSFLSQVL